MQPYSVSLVGVQLAKQHVATSGQAVRLLTDHVDLIAVMPIHPVPSLIRGEESKSPMTTYADGEHKKRSEWSAHKNTPS